jgi:hypothetical protein
MLCGSKWYTAPFEKGWNNEQSPGILSSILNIKLPGLQFRNE